MKFFKFLKTYMFSLTISLMVISTILGIYFHSVFLTLKPTLPLALFVMLYPMMIGPDFRRLGQFGTSWKYVMNNLLLNIIISPLLIYALLQIIPIQNPAFLAGLVLIAVAPMAGSAAAFTGLAGGNVPLTLLGVTLTLLVSIFTVPLYTKFLVGTFIYVPVMKLFYSILIYVVVPLILGQLTRYLWIRQKGEAHFKANKEILSGISMVGMYWMVIMVFGLEGAIVLHHPALAGKAIVLMFIFYVVLFSLALLLAKLFKFNYADMVSLYYSTCKNMSISTALAIASFGPLGGIGTAMGGPFTDMWMMILSVRFLPKLKNWFTNEESSAHEKLLVNKNTV